MNIRLSDWVKDADRDASLRFEILDRGNYGPNDIVLLGSQGAELELKMFDRLSELRDRREAHIPVRVAVLDGFTRSEALLNIVVTAANAPPEMDLPFSVQNKNMLLFARHPMAGQIIKPFNEYMGLSFFGTRAVDLNALLKATPNHSLKKMQSQLWGRTVLVGEGRNPAGLTGTDLNPTGLLVDISTVGDYAPQRVDIKGYRAGQVVARHTLTVGPQSNPLVYLPESFRNLSKLEVASPGPNPVAFASIALDDWLTRRQGEGPIALDLAKLTFDPDAKPGEVPRFSVAKTEPVGAPVSLASDGVTLVFDPSEVNATIKPDKPLEFKVSLEAEDKTGAVGKGELTFVVAAPKPGEIRFTRPLRGRIWARGTSALIPISRFFEHPDFSSRKSEFKYHFEPALVPGETYPVTFTQLVRDGDPSWVEIVVKDFATRLAPGERLPFKFVVSVTDPAGNTKSTQGDLWIEGNH